MGVLDVILLVWHWLVSIAGTVAVACVILAFVFFVVEIIIYKTKKRRDRS